MMPQRTFKAMELAECARRELVQRQRVYPRLIASGRMSEMEAERQLAMMREILRILRERAQPGLGL